MILSEFLMEELERIIVEGFSKLPPIHHENKT